MGDLPRMNKAARKERFQKLGWWSWFLERRTHLGLGMDAGEANRLASEDVERLHADGKLPSEVDPIALPKNFTEALGGAPGAPRLVVKDERVCRDVRSLIWYLYEHMDDLSATPDRAPSRGAWYQLQAMRSDPALKADFYRNVWVKVMPKGGFKESGEDDVPSDTAIVGVADVYKALDAAANSEGLGEESEVEDGGSDAGGAESVVSAGADEGV